MPEGYTHIRTAKRALARTKIKVTDENSFGLGANGPDILFSYKAWVSSSRRGDNLPLIGGRLHDENTGAFLRSIIQNAGTHSQRSYVLGFLSHYAADCIIHPYIVYLCQKGQPYCRVGGHGYSEIAIDSYLHKLDTGKACVRVDDNTPYTDGKVLEDNAILLKWGIKDALNIDVRLKSICDSFRHTRMMRKMFVSPLKIKYAFFYILEPLFGGRGKITGHITPVKLKPLPDTWVNPFTWKEEKGGLDALLEKAEKLSSEYMEAAVKFWDGKMTLSEITMLLGSKSYLKGIPDDESLGYYIKS